LLISPEFGNSAGKSIPNAAGSKKFAARKPECVSLVSDEKKKKEHEKATERERAALALLQDKRNENKAADKWSHKDLKTLIAWKQNKPCPSKLSKAECLAMWLELKDSEVATVPWSTEDEAEIQALQKKVDDDIALDNTQYGRNLQEKKHELKAIYKSLSQEERVDWLEESNDNTSTTAEEEGDDVAELVELGFI
jgi:hypothetical protein